MIRYNMAYIPTEISLVPIGFTDKMPSDLLRDLGDRNAETPGIEGRRKSF